MNTPLSREDYKTLFYGDWGVSLTDALNRNGLCNLTVCPECGCDDFSHAEGCGIRAEVYREMDV